MKSKRKKKPQPVSKDFLEALERLRVDLKDMNNISVLADGIHGRCVSIMTEDVAFYAEWIKGEGGDISLYRALDDNRLIGALLPLRNWSGVFRTGGNA